MADKGKPTPREDLLNHVFKVMRENEEFLQEKARETCNEVIELVNDAIDYTLSSVERGTKYYVERSVSFFVHHVLMPFSYAIYLDLLAGNLPACFMELRFVLESLAECYLADSKYPSQTFFQERVESLRKEMGKKELSTSKLMKQLGQELELGKHFVALWGKLSHDWVHPWGIVDRVVDQIVEKSNVPPWALTIPMNYTDDDLDDLDELRDRISDFRALLKVTMEKYQS